MELWHRWGQHMWGMIAEQLHSYQVGSSTNLFEKKKIVVEIICGVYILIILNLVRASLSVWIGRYGLGCDHIYRWVEQGKTMKSVEN